MRKLIASAAMLVALSAAAGAAQAQQAQPFKAEGWKYGTRNDATAPAAVWNPAKKKLMEGGDLIGGTIRGTDPRIYCAMAGAGYDFTWTEKQHEAIDWEQAARMWRTCPRGAGVAVPGVRVAYTDEREIQHALDMGAMVLVVPTVDTVEEAREVVSWAYYPPVGRRSSGGGQGPSEMWADVPGGYRQTFNDNLVLVVMIETLEGVENAREIAKVPGVTAIFAASGDLGNFSGYKEGDPEYERLVTEIHDAGGGGRGEALRPAALARPPRLHLLPGQRRGGRDQGRRRRRAEADDTN
jgi:2-keto-3-deoxy-L-rhamnonate aldolase RhmA